MKTGQRRRQSTGQKVVTLNLVSLMDIFTILVFFLMVNANEVELLETASDIELPDSITEIKPEEQAVLEITPAVVMFGGEAVMSVEALMAPTIAQFENGSLTAADFALVRVLSEVAQSEAGAGQSAPGAITIMGDKALPYEVLKRVMLICQQANFSRIALAVNQVGTEVASR